ncbi:1-deoxy-D-xylulose-5-phosphate reductoisomerase [Atopobium deltae]|uniref:1-deoxy-D-xylulose 5-phosphate reductoisomerase n=1 Tax=Atopobium deltae TaxID=1393034 RepID=A0A133XX10_9ACTN|nr:1-deoxy-D-xylulose 5-phosphate reductoisomerase [Atopobium deltae]
MSILHTPQDASQFASQHTLQDASQPLHVAILGATGSVGLQALDVCRKHADKLQVVAMSARNSVEKLLSLAQEFGVTQLAFSDEAQKDNPAILKWADSQRQHPVATPQTTSVPAPQMSSLAIGFGSQAVADLAALEEVDLVLVSVVGAAGILPAYTALINDKILALANKEALVCAGDLLMPLVRPGKLIPVDSEHSAIFQCLAGVPASQLARIWLTCSGGPFYGKTTHELRDVTAEQALKHPNWRMGPKITIDSATLMNKGFEVLEAHHLFGVPVDDITVLIQRQSSIHSMIENTDGSVIAQLGPSDMRNPIQYAFSYPERWDPPAKPLDFCQMAPLEFGKPDEKTFRCLALAREAGRLGGSVPCVVNAANEIANLAFRQGRISFLHIADVVEHVMNRMDAQALTSLEQALELDQQARKLATEYTHEVAL